MGWLFDERRAGGFFAVWLVIISCFALASCQQAKAPNVVIESLAPELKILPGDAAPGHNSEALTQWFFHCRPECEYDQLSGPGSQALTVRITKVRLRIGLSVLQHLPPDAPANLVSHENGHKQICCRIYMQAPAAARAACEAVIGREFRSYAANREQAKRQVLDQAARSICGAYTEKINGLSAAVSSMYDLITAHGAGKLPVQQAVDRAFEQVHRQGY